MSCTEGCVCSCTESSDIISYTVNIFSFVARHASSIALSHQNHATVECSCTIADL